MSTIRWNPFVTAHSARRTDDVVEEQDVWAGTGWEDRFTEALAFYLAVDRDALTAYSRFVTNDHRAEPLEIETQWGPDGPRPDMRISLASGQRLLLEHKIDQALGPGQLESYLAYEKPDETVYVALFSRRRQAVPAVVLENPRYLRPNGADYFSWRDLFATLPVQGDGLGVFAFRKAFHDYMRRLGFGASTLDEHWQRLFLDRTVDENRAVQQDFGRRLDELRRRVEAMGFRTTSVSHSGFSANPKTPMPFNRVSVHPWLAPIEMMTKDCSAEVGREALGVLLTYAHTRPTDSDWGVHRGFGAKFVDPTGATWHAIEPYTTTNDRTRISFVAPVRHFVQGNESNISRRLSEGVGAVIERVLGLVRARTGPASEGAQR